MMKTVKLAIGADHRGYALKQYLQKNCHVDGFEIIWTDVGAHDDQRSNYPTFAILAAQLVQDKQVDGAVLLCGTGVGMGIAANRFNGVYAAVVWNPEIAQLSREDDHANVIALPADYVDQQKACECVKSWLKAEPKPGLYNKRIKMIDLI